MPSLPVPKFAGKALTAELRKLALEIHTATPDGTPLTREQSLAEMIWRQALGWEEVTRDEDGNLKKIKHLPVAWCQQFLFERMEGKAPQAIQDEQGGIKAADKVRELAKQRVNALSAVASGPPKPKQSTPKET